MKTKPLFPGMIFTAVTLSISPWFMREPKHGGAPLPAAARAAAGQDLATRRPTVKPPPEADEESALAADPCQLGNTVTPSGAPCPAPDAAETAFLDREAGSRADAASAPAPDQPASPASDPDQSASPAPQTATVEPETAASPDASPADSRQLAADIAAASQQPLEVVQSLRESGLGWDEVAQSLGLAPGTWRPGLGSHGLPLAALNPHAASPLPQTLPAAGAVTPSPLSQAGSQASSDPQAPPSSPQQAPSSPPPAQQQPQPPSAPTQTPPAPPSQVSQTPPAPPQQQAPSAPPPVPPPAPPDIGRHGHHPPGQDGDQGRLEQHGGQQGVHGR